MIERPPEGPPNVTIPEVGLPTPLILLSVLLAAVVLALVFACAPTPSAPCPPAPECVRLGLSHSPDAGAGERIARGEVVERTPAAEVAVCDSTSVSLPPGMSGTLFIDVKAIGTEDELRAEVQP